MPRRRVGRRCVSDGLQCKILSCSGVKSTYDQLEIPAPADSKHSLSFRRVWISSFKHKWINWMWVGGDVVSGGWFPEHRSELALALTWWTCSGILESVLITVRLRYRFKYFFAFALGCVVFWNQWHDTKSVNPTHLFLFAGSDAPGKINRAQKSIWIKTSIWKTKPIWNKVW